MLGYEFKGKMFSDTYVYNTEISLLLVVRIATVREKVREKIFFQDHGKVREFC